jgi:lysophospholipase L1-like esterase
MFVDQNSLARSTAHTRHRRAALVTATMVAALVLVCSPLLAPAASAAETPGTAGLNYVALGDSYSAGFGLTPLTGTPVAGCAQSSSNYPHRVAAALGMNLTDVTCSGATTANITGPQPTQGGTAPAQISALNAETDVVTLTIGGNDVGFSSIVASCVALSPTGPLALSPTVPNCASVLTADSSLLALQAALPASITSALTAVRTAAPNAKVFVLGYPSITPDPTNTPASGCFIPAVTPEGQPTGLAYSFPFTDVDVTYLHTFEVAVNSVVESTAAAAGATYVPTFAPSVAHSACAPAGQSYINGFSLASPDAAGAALGALHPNDAGTDFLGTYAAASITRAFPARVVPTPEPTPTADPAAVAPSTLPSAQPTTGAVRAQKPELAATGILTPQALLASSAALLVLIAGLTGVLGGRRRIRRFDTKSDEADAGPQAGAHVKHLGATPERQGAEAGTHQVGKP